MTTTASAKTGLRRRRSAVPGPAPQPTPEPVGTPELRPAPERANSEGIVGIYAARVLDRGGDLRAIAAEVRHARFGTPERLTAPTVVATRPELVGRASETLPAAPRRTAAPAVAQPVRDPLAAPRRPQRRLVAAAVAALLMLPFAALVARATESPAATRPAVTAEHAGGEVVADPTR